jgi:hypothetical protein
MAMPPNPSPETSRWWSDFFLYQHRKGSTVETEFLGFLATRALHPNALTPSQLDTQWTNFLAFKATS